MRRPKEGQVAKTGNWKRTQEESGVEEGGRAVFMVVGKAARLGRRRDARSGGR